MIICCKPVRSLEKKPELTAFGPLWFHTASSFRKKAATFMSKVRFHSATVLLIHFLCTFTLCRVLKVDFHKGGLTTVSAFVDLHRQSDWTHINARSYAIYARELQKNATNKNNNCIELCAVWTVCASSKGLLAKERHKCVWALAWA